MTYYTVFPTRYRIYCRRVFWKCCIFTAGLKIKSKQLRKESQEKHRSKDNAIFCSRNYI